MCESDYPKIDCGKHGRVDTCYFICPHVAQKGREYVYHFYRASKDDAGEISCLECYESKTPDQLNHFAMWCQKCCMESGLTSVCQ